MVVHTRMLLLLVLVLIGGLLPVASPASAANGDFVGEVRFSQNCSSSIGVGIAYDGAGHLWVSCHDSSPDLLRASATTGVVDRTYTIVGDLGAIAYDATHNGLWAAEEGHVYFIQLDAGRNVVSSGLKFSPGADAEGLVDGLAYDATDDTLYFKPDVSNPIHHYTTAGVKLGDLQGANSCIGPLGSGLAIGGDDLYEGKNGCSHVYVVHKKTLAPVFDFSTFIASDPNHRDEGLTCDTQTFAGQGKQVMWSKEAFSPNRAAAFQIPAGTCGVGGQHALQDFKQNRKADGTYQPWGLATLYDVAACPTMASSGCAITSVADVLASYGMQTLPDGSALDPGTLNHFLGQKGARSACDIAWDTTSRVVNYELVRNDYAKTPLATRLQHIDEALAAGNLVIIGIAAKGSGMHFVVVYDKAPNPAPDGSPDYRIADPFRYTPYATGDQSGKLLSEAYRPINQDKDRLHVIVYANKAPQPGKSWTIVAHSPVEMLVTDPNGKRTGFDRQTGREVQDIPGSSYGLEEGIADDEGTAPPLPDALYFGQTNLTPGTYKVEVVGTGTGPYTLDFGFASGPNDTSNQTVRGSALPRSVDTYLVTVSATPGQPAVVQRQVAIDIKPGGTPNAINAGNAGVVPVAVLSGATFDATRVDVRSLRFGPAGAPAADKQLGVEDVDRDGRPDGVAHFPTAQTGITAGATQACLSGRTADGLAIVGCDTVVTVPRS